MSANAEPAASTTAPPSPLEEGRTPRPLILVRGFGFFDIRDEQRNAYQGFNDGTVYPGRTGQNYIYEGFVLRALKSDRYRYTDATNVVAYYSDKLTPDPAQDRGGFAVADVGGDKVVIDPTTAAEVLAGGVAGTIWIYRYYDLEPRSMETYGEGLARLIRLIHKASTIHGPVHTDGVDIVAHSMGGLVVREALRILHKDNDSARNLVHKIVTLGTPHRGIAFQVLPQWLTAKVGVQRGANELDAFDSGKVEFMKTGTYFDVDRILTVVGTDYKSYGTKAATVGNRIASAYDEGTLATNRSDGLVKHSAAQLPGAPRTFVAKCHGGVDSLVTSREAYEIAMRFFNGTHHVHLRLEKAQITQGADLLFRSEYYFGVSIKPRGVDFELFHQTKAAENCYGPFHKRDLSDGPPGLKSQLELSMAEPGDKTTGWADDNKLIWEGWIDQRAVPDPDKPEMVFRLEVYVGERDTRITGFSDNVIFHKQYYVQVCIKKEPEIFVHTAADLISQTNPTPLEEIKAEAKKLVGLMRKRRQASPGPSLPSPKVQRATRSKDGYWTFPVGGTGFSATLRLEIDKVLVP